jgi:mono/diheme cytochrome c family protein
MLMISAAVVAAIFVIFLIYMIYDPIRAQAAKQRQFDDSLERGAATYAQYCTVCHGPLGEGCIGPALNTDKNRKGTEEQLADRADYLAKTIARGRASNQPHVAMPNWGIEEGGQLTDKQIHDLVVFIQHGDFNVVPDQETVGALNSQAKPPKGKADDATYNGATTLLQSKGCINCHTIGSYGRPLSADLTDVGSRRTEAWLRKWIPDTSAMPPVDPNYKPGTLTQPSRDVGRGPNLWLSTGQQPFDMGTTFMPKIQLTDQELDTLVRYLIAIRQE